VPVRLVFESALELMSCTQIGTFQVTRPPRPSEPTGRCTCMCCKPLDPLPPTAQCLVHHTADGTKWQVKGTATNGQEGPKWSAQQLASDVILL
jgi:hypothetical protein